MRVKVAGQWYHAEKGRPIMVELTAFDKENIANMIEGATKYAEFHDDDGTTPEEKLAWMKEGASNATEEATATGEQTTSADVRT